MRHLLAVHLGAERGVAEDDVLGKHAGAQDVARAVDVLDEHVERFDALLEAGADALPLGVGEDARDDVERDQPFLRVGLAVDREGDADAPE